VRTMSISVSFSRQVALLAICASGSAACSSGSAERQSSPAIAARPTTATPTQPVERAAPPTPSPEQLSGTPVALHGALHTEGAKLMDEHGAVVQLRGPSSMWLNWEQSGYASNPDLLTLMRDSWGATLVRAAMGVDAPGAYLTVPDKAERDLRAVVDNAINLGLYVIIDWHDHEALDHVEESVAFFKKMATTYGGYPNIIYEVFNEPLQLDWSTELKPYHERLVSEIRAIDPDNLIILGTPNWSQYVDDASDDPVVGENLAYTLHFYSCTHKREFRNRGDWALNRNVPVFVTEWGASHSDGGTADNPGLCLDEAELWHEWMNTHQISWAAWKLDDCPDETCYFTAGAPADGSFRPDQLTAHGAFVRDKMMTATASAQ